MKRFWFVLILGWSSWAQAKEVRPVSLPVLQPLALAAGAFASALTGAGNYAPQAVALPPTALTTTAEPDQALRQAMPQAKALGQSESAGGIQEADRFKEAFDNARPSIRGRIKDADLPTSGRFHYMPPPSLHPGNPLPVVKTGRKKAYVDRFGNLWKTGPYHGKPGPDAPSFEWDVQLSESGRAVWGRFSHGRGYINVTPKGRLSH